MDKAVTNWTLAITGKGGVGKTTLAALAVRWLCEQARSPVLAVDADPNTCLDALLGVEVTSTVGRVREEAKQLTQGGTAGSVSKEAWLDLKIQESMVEMDGFDLIAMGRSEGPGCYCYANNVLRGVLARLAGHYPAVVVDNEAGLENLSRRTVQEVSQMLFVSDPSLRGIMTARRLYDLSLEMAIAAESSGLVINRARDARCLERAHELFAGTDVAILGTLPEDEELAEHAVEGSSVFGLSPDNGTYSAISAILKTMMK
jgi:CO dehydrogenase maturation factor|tara:strand:+ start:5336 stop:6112 length:777 start_codon:yes stop_codon:yes gene_type:complete